MDVKLLVDGEEIDLNEFVAKILSGTIAGAVTSLRGIKKDWKEIEIKVTRSEGFNYPAVSMRIVISANMSLFALHIGQMYGGSSRKTT